MSMIQNELGGLIATHEINLRTKDSKIDFLFAKHVKSQQARLVKENLPGFEITDDHDKIRSQMNLLQALQKLPNSA